MKRRIKYKSNNEISRPGAIFMAVISLFLAVGLSTPFFSNKPIEKTEAIEKTAVFDYYEEDYGVGRRGANSVDYIVLFLENGEKEEIRSACMNKYVWNDLKDLKKGTELHMLINPNNNYIIELQTDSKEILNFDFAQNRLFREGIAFLALAIFFFVGGFCYFVYKAITTKEKGLTREDIKEFWEIYKMNREFDKK